ncbi:MAG TPA: preprotein translocase subunit SecG [Aestuariivirgaceae bacterium]|jgi:preprotein translocase subunit SecG|nr:preprotein translocase subunit SecG [Aestuariivirgaceae bacterium]
MSAVLLIIHLLIAIALIVTVLLQRSEGGALGIGGGGAGALFSSRGTANVLTRSTAVLAVAFFITSIALTILARQGSNSGSVFDRAPPSGTQQNAPVAPGSGGGAVLPRLPGAAPPQQPAPVAPAAPPSGPQVPTTE